MTSIAGTPPIDVPDRIVIVGGGQAGLGAAAELRGRGHSGPITVVDPAEFPYERPPLSKAFLLGEADLAAIRSVPAGWFDEHDVALRGGRRAVRLDAGQGAVELDDGSTVGADAVLLSVGGRARSLPVPGGDHARVHVLRTADQATALRAELTAAARVVVVGGGLIGAEVASSALKLGCSVSIVEPMTPPLVPAVGPEIAALLHEQHIRAGITVVADVVAEIVDDAGRPTVVTRSGRKLASDVVVVGIGMRAGTELAAAAGLEVDGGVVVDARHRTSNPAVFAAGDGVRVRGADGVVRAHEHWQAAKAAGRAAGAAVLGLEPPAAETEWFWSDRHGCHVEVAGSMNGPRRLLRGDPSTTPFSVLSLDDTGRLLGVAAIDDTRMVGAGRRMIQAGTVPDPDLLVDPSVNPRKLLRS